jgi:hypothetical protein
LVVYVGAVRCERIGCGGSNAVCLASTSNNGELAGEVLSLAIVDSVTVDSLTVSLSRLLVFEGIENSVL